MWDALPGNEGLVILNKKDLELLTSEAPLDSYEDIFNQIDEGELEDDPVKEEEDFQWYLPASTEKEQEEFEIEPINIEPSYDKRDLELFSAVDVPQSLRYRAELPRTDRKQGQSEDSTSPVPTTTSAPVKRGQPEKATFLENHSDPRFGWKQFLFVLNNRQLFILWSDSETKRHGSSSILT